MIELRRARPGEEAAVAALWNQVFGDDETFLVDFYRLCVPYDRILVLGKSGIEEEGRHEELLAKEGIYYRLWNGLVSGQTL